MSFRRHNCSSCLSERNECAWCEQTSTCFPFVEYMMRYAYGKVSMIEIHPILFISPFSCGFFIYLIILLKTSFAVYSMG